MRFFHKQELRLTSRVKLIKPATTSSRETFGEAERQAFASRIMELEAHNHLLTQAATDYAYRLQEMERELTTVRVDAVRCIHNLQRELTQSRTEIATLQPANVRLEAEVAFFA